MLLWGGRSLKGSVELPELRPHCVPTELLSVPAPSSGFRSQAAMQAVTISAVSALEQLGSPAQTLLSGQAIGFARSSDHALVRSVRSVQWVSVD